MTAKASPTDKTPAGSRGIIWINVSTVLSAVILIGAEVFGAAFAGSWAIANLLGLGSTVGRILDVVFLCLGAYIMYRFVQFARKVEPFSR